MKLIILDKSFIDRPEGSSEVAKLCENATVVMTEALFYELITTNKYSLQRCFSNLPDRQNPMMLVELGTLLNFEIENECPYGELSEHAVKESYHFNERLREGNFIFGEKVNKNKEQWQQKVKKRTEDFVNRCLSVHEFFPELNGIPYRDFPEAIDKARHIVAEDNVFVGNICSKIFEISNGTKLSRFNANWALFRLIQCQMLWALRLFCKWQGHYPKEVGKQFYLKMEHSMLDVDYVVVGALAGGLATFDNEIREDFRIVCPHGELIPAERVHE